MIKSKDVLVVQYASRRYEFRPIFSQPVSGGSENNVRKFERYLQLGRTSIASWIGKTVIGKEVPVLFFKKTSEGIILNDLRLSDLLRSYNSLFLASASISFPVY